jgi:hypothetical protein
VWLVFNELIYGAKMKSIYSLIIIVLFFSFSGFAQKDLGDGWKITGQVGLRSELDGRDFSNDTHPLTFTSLRTRLGVEKSFENRVVLYIQFQDSRIFGSELSTLSNSKNIDLHQGYVKLNKLFDWDWTIQAGRFEVSYGTQRFFGAVGWHFVGRSFDGVRFEIAPEKLGIELFALTVRESVNYIGNAIPERYPYPQEPTPSQSIYGIWKKTKFDDNNKLHLFGYWDINRLKAGEDTCLLNMPTIGGSYWGNFGNVSTIIEAAYQFGERVGRDISAYLLSAGVYYKAGITKIGIGADILSGTNPDDQDTKFNTYQATYGTNHKFYGYMDYFINIPLNTMNLGLNDYYLTTNFKPEDSKWRFGLNIHHFRSNRSADDITLPGNSSASSENTFGQEIDLTIRYSFIKGTTLVWGGSVFFPSGLMKYAFEPREDMAYWTYVMIVANL